MIVALSGITSEPLGSDSLGSHEEEVEIGRSLPWVKPWIQITKIEVGVSFRKTVEGSRRNGSTIDVVNYGNRI